MKFLIVNTRHYFGGGDSTYTFNLASLLKQKGNNVSFFAMQNARNLPELNEDLFVPFIDFRELNEEKNLINGLKVLGRVVYSQVARQKFSALLDRVKPDIVHLQNIHAHITPSIIFEAKKRGLPVVWTLHDYKLICPNSHLLIDATGQICEACVKGSFWYAPLKRCKKDSFLASGMAAIEAYAHSLMGVRKKVDAYLAPSAFLANKLREGGFLENVYHVPLFIGKDFFQDQNQDDGYILFFGRLDFLKGIYTLLDACLRLPNIRVRIAGRINAGEEATFKSRFGPNVEYVGMKSGGELHQLVGHCRAVVVPSIWYENQPFSILEAFAAGKPVIASDLGGMSELVTHMERGLLVKPNDSEELAGAMTWMNEHPEEARKMGASARVYAEKEHSSELHLEKIMGIYNYFLGTH